MTPECETTIATYRQPEGSSMAEMAVQGLLEFWPCKSVNNPNFGLPIIAARVLKMGRLRQNKNDSTKSTIFLKLELFLTEWNYSQGF